MAKNKHYRWRDWRVDERGASINDSDERKPKRNKARKGSGITNEQAKFLAALQRHAGLKYTGNGMSRADAAALISRLVDERDARREARPMRQPVRSPKGWTPAEQALIADAMSKQVLPPPASASALHGLELRRGDELDIEWDAKLEDEAA